MNNELALLCSAETVNESGRGSQSLIQDVTHRLPPGMRREFRSYLSSAGFDRPALVDRDVAESMTALTSGSPAASGTTVFPSPLRDGCRRPWSTRQ